MTKFGISQPVRRLEDERLITGQGRYTDDIAAEGQLYGYVLRSPVASARFKAVDVTAARSAPGIVDIILGDELDGAGANNLPTLVHLPGGKEPQRPILATRRVRFVGDAIAFIVGETPAAARAAAQLIDIDFETLPAATDTATADAAGQPQVHDDVPGNLFLEWTHGDEAATAAAFKSAAHVVKKRIINNRIVVAAMEPRAGLAVPDSEGGGLTLYAPSQGPWNIRNQLAKDILKIDPGKLRVITPDVGGGFGMKAFTYPEYAMVLWAARKLNRPVKWTADRTESFLCDTMGRDNVTDFELAFDADHRIVAMRTETRAAMGAYLSMFAPFIPKAGLNVMPGVYDVKQIFTRVKQVATNTVPVDAYRGAGRPEAIYAIERMIDYAARQFGMSPVELRKKNFIPASAMPFRTVTDNLYDSGDFVRIMDKALAAADHAGFAKRREESRRRGKLRGFGICTYIESVMGNPEESAFIRFEPDGKVAIYAGTQTNGQGHETVYAQFLTDMLGVPIERVRLVNGDTALIAKGGGTGGSRSVTAQGLAIRGASREVIKKGLTLASEELEASPEDIEFKDGSFSVVGTDKRVGILELAEKTATEDGTNKLDATATTKVPAWTFPNGCHLAEVEIDPDTGQVVIARYKIVDDFGRIINPMLIEGQVHGGVVQGVGQAIYEHTVYADDGQLLTGSFMDYAVPRAEDVPFFEFETVEILTENNEIGMKGAGEAGTVGALAAVMNGIQDALAQAGVDQIDMPATPLRIWKAIQDAKKDKAA
ncbi:xanthine dehydrogenase family protein molybdopterin-binding subunit [soil metagenome]